MSAATEMPSTGIASWMIGGITVLVAGAGALLRKFAKIGAQAHG